MVIAGKLDCIYLQPNSSILGGHELLHIATYKIIQCFHITNTPVTSIIIKQIHKITESENIPKGLKINYLHYFIAGVQDQPHQNQNYDNEYDNKSTSSTESEEETKLMKIINDMEGYEYDESKHDKQEEQVESKYNNQIEMESYQDEDELSFSELENLLDNCKYMCQNMDENIQEDITEQSNEDEDNENSYNKDEENESINELMKRDK